MPEAPLTACGPGTVAAMGDVEFFAFDPDTDPEDIVNALLAAAGEGEGEGEHQGQDEGEDEGEGAEG